MTAPARELALEAAALAQAITPGDALASGYDDAADLAQALALASIALSLAELNERDAQRERETTIGEVKWGLRELVARGAIEPTDDPDTYLALDNPPEDAA